jgi:hypothetical protein
LSIFFQNFSKKFRNISEFSIYLLNNQLRIQYVSSFTASLEPNPVILAETGGIYQAAPAARRKPGTPPARGLVSLQATAAAPSRAGNGTPASPLPFGSPIP